MADHETPLTNDGAQLPSTALLPANGNSAVLEQRNGEWTSMPVVPETPTIAVFDGMALLHGVRRHWLLCIGLGILCASVLGPAAYIGIGAKYTAQAILQISLEEQAILGGTQRITADRERFEIFKNTQQQLQVSRFVLLAALRKTDVAKLDIIQEQRRIGDPVGWLMKQVSVSFPGRAEIMSVSVSRPNAKEAAILVQAVVDAYLNEVVNAEREEKRIRMSELEHAFTAKDAEIRAKRKDLKNMEEQLGTSDTETLSLRQRLVLEELSQRRQELSKARLDWQQAEGQKTAQEAFLQSINETGLLGAELDEAVQRDPVANRLFLALGEQSINKAYTEQAVVAGTGSKYAGRFNQEMKTMQQQYENRRNELAEMVRQKKEAAVKSEILKFETIAKVAKEQADGIQIEVTRLQDEAKKFGNSTVESEMLRGQVKTLEEMTSVLSKDLEQLRVELNSPPRVTLRHAAEIPELPSNDMFRMAVSFFAMCVGLVLPAVAIVGWDCRIRRVNTSDDLSKGLGMSVIGSVPRIPTRVLRRLGSSSKRCQAWQLRLTESVDGIAARVLRKADTDQWRTVMVSSAVSGEGKTTLATQLAMSLARTGRRTVLVDFDLRRPSFDEVFGISLEPGVCEVLRGQAEMASLVHETETENLCVVSAGHWDRRTLASLSNGVAGKLLKYLAEKFDFVIVDTSPILPVADARFVSQHVDAVLLAVFRDVSEVDKVQATCEILNAFGAYAIEIVVTGTEDHSYGNHIGYESAISG